MRTDLTRKTDSDSGLGPGLLPVEVKNGRILLVDQRKLPEELCYFDATDFQAMCLAIKDMIVRGAPSIGVAAAYGMAARAKEIAAGIEAMDEFLKQLDEAKKEIDETRPTAVNLAWASAKMMARARELSQSCQSPGQLAARLFDYAAEILNDHIQVNKTLSDFGAELVGDNYRIMTHCNAGSLAACGWGTALGVIRSAHLLGRNVSVLVDETRPRNQGAKLTMWELIADGIEATLVCDSMSGYLMSQGKVNMVITGADRIARNGDTANKIGTYNLAVVAAFHNVPFYVAAPISTIDPHLKDGSGIPIEFRSPDEVTMTEGRLGTVKGASALNPSFDVTPAKLIAGIITEAGVLRGPYEESIEKALEKLGALPRK